MAVTITITLPEKVELALSSEARRLGTTPELLAAEILHDRLDHSRVSNNSNGASDVASTQPVPNNLAEFLGEFVGCVDSSRGTDRKSNLSERTGEAFAEILEQKRREGRL